MCASPFGVSRFALGFAVVLAACGSSSSSPPIPEADSRVEDGARDSAPSEDTSVADALDATSKPASILFVGNSYTYVGDLPTQVRDLAASGKTELTIDSVVLGGATLQMHYATTGALAKIREAKWTYVVLQGQSVEPIYYAANFQEYAKKLADEVKLAGAKPVFYETWARRAGDAIYDDPASGGDPAGMQAKLRAEYAKAATANDGLLARVGDAREIALAKTFTFSLFDPDGSHPTVEGAYLGACVFHKVLTGRVSLGLSSRPTSLTATDASALQTIADSVTP